MNKSQENIKNGSKIISKQTDAFVQASDDEIWASLTAMGLLARERFTDLDVFGDYR